MEDELIKLSTKERIIKVTMEIIAAEGFQNVTIRKIATRADVNIAAVNYHFGCKDAVINEALKAVTNKMINAFSHLKDSNDPQERLRLFITDYVEVLISYPDIIKIIIDQNIHKYSIQVAEEYQEYLKIEGRELIKTTIKAIRPDESEILCNMRVLQLLSCLVFPVLMGDKVIEISQIDWKDAGNREIYTMLLMNNIAVNSISLDF
jgi:TetR/AcrR family transcriptional regulator, regulator of cefoperazone and chloramphenicol sensitivity